MTEPLHITPLGGVGEFGMNCMMFDHGDHRLIVDCGGMFPDVEHYGVDLIVPDFKTIESKSVDALLLTHGHEDHIGAIPWLVMAHREVSDTKLDILGTDFTLALVRRKLDEHNLLGNVVLRTIKAGGTQTIGPFALEFIHVNHSVPACVSVAITTGIGTVVMTGDWRIDPTPIGEALIDFAAFSRIGKKGVRLFLGDSTNVQSEGSSVSEKVVQAEIEDLLDIAAGRVFFTMFSSNIWRIQGILNAAHAVGRKVAVLGRSLKQNIGAARETGYLIMPDANVLIDIDEARNYDDDELVIVAAGSQGEPMSNMTRLAFGEHNAASIKQGDWVVYSARMIPGNIKKIGKVVDALYTRGAEVVIPRKRNLHTTGHAYRDEITTLLNIVRPKVVMPVHGTMRMLAKHAALAKDLGLGSVIVTNGNRLTLNADSHHISSEIGLTPTYVVGSTVGEVDDEILRQRRQIGYTGVLIIHATLSADGQILKAPALQHHGVIENDVHLATAEANAMKALKGALKAGVKHEEVIEEIRVAVRRYFKKEIGRKPVVIPIIDVLD